MNGEPRSDPVAGLIHIVKGTGEGNTLPIVLEGRGVLVVTGSDVVSSIRMFDLDGTVHDLKITYEKGNVNPPCRER